jgi:autotransporter-associated beta strand protein
MKSPKSTSPLFRSQAFPCAITLSLLAAGSAVAADGTWTGGTSTNWATTANWSGGTVAGSTNANSDTATFNSANYSFAPTIANGWFLGTLLFGSGNTGALTVITGNNTERLNLSVGIQMDAGSGAVIIGAAQNRGIALLNNVSFANNSSSLLTVRVLTVDESVLSGTNTVTINGSGSGGFTLSAPAVDGTGGAKLALNINTSGGATSLGEASTYSGGTTLSAGTLQVGVASVGSLVAITSSAIGTGSLALNGGTLSSGSGTARTILNAVTIGGNVTLGNATNTGTITMSNSVDLGGSARTLTTASAVNIDGIVSNGGITKLGTGVLSLRGASANTYTGLTTVSAGGLTLNKTAGNAIAGDVNIDTTGTLTLGAADQIINTANVEIATGGTFALAGFTETVNGVKLTGGAITGTAGNTLTSTTAYDFQSGSATAILAGTAGATKSGSGTVTLSGASANTYTGLTTVSAGGLTLSKTAVVAIAGNVLVNGTGTLTLGAADQINNDSDVEVAAGTFALGGNTDTVNNVKLTGGIITGTTGVLTSSTAYDFQSSGNVTGILAGTAGANKTTAGTVTFSGGNTNTYTGLTTVSAGSLVLSKTAGVVALAGDALVNGGTLQIGRADQIQDTANLEVATNGTFAMGGNSDTVNNLKLTGGAITGSGTLTSSTAFDFQSSGNIGAVLAGAAGANKTTAGTVTFSGANANTYTGLTTVSAGSLVLSKTAGVVALAGDALVNGGTLQISSANQIVDTANLEVATNGTFALGGNADTVNGVKLTGGAITGTGVNGILTSVTAYDLQSGSSSAVLAGTAGATKTTAGTVALNRASTYSGGTTLSAGTLQLGVASVGSVGAITSSAIGTDSLALNGGTLSSDSTSGRTILNAITIGSNVTLGDATNTGKLTFSAGVDLGAVNRDLTTESSVAFDGAVSGAGGLTKLGTATMTLTGANTYTGATNVDTGTLVVNGNISTSTLTTVAVGATLGGSGTVGKTTVNGTLAVGNSPGQMNFTDTLTIAGSTVMEIDGSLGAGVTNGYDFVNLTGLDAAGVLTYGGTMTLDIGMIFGVGNYSFNLFDFASETGTFATITLADQYSGSFLDGDLNGVWDLTSGDSTWQFTESTGVLGLTVVPEPHAALLGGLGMLALLRRRRCA